MRIPQVLVHNGELCFKVFPCLISCYFLLQGLTIVVEESGAKNNLVRGLGDLLFGVWGVTGCCIIKHVFDLVNQHFKRLVRILTLLHALVIMFQISLCDARIGVFVFNSGHRSEITCSL